LFHDDFAQPFSTSTASKIETEDSVGKSITFIDGYCVGDTISRVDNDTGGST
jgi:hypothetical protein